MDEFFWGETLEATPQTVFDMTADFATRANPEWPDIDQAQNLKAVWNNDGRGRKISIVASHGKDAVEVPLIDVRVGTAGNTASHVEIYRRFGDVELAETLRDYYLSCLNSAKRAASGADAESVWKTQFRAKWPYDFLGKSEAEAAQMLEDAWRNYELKKIYKAEAELERLSAEAEVVTAFKETSELFRRGIWASDFDTLGKLLRDFARENQNEPFGKDALLFTLYDVEINDGRLVKAVHPIERIWLIGTHGKLVTDIAGIRNPDFEGHPYGKVVASRGLGGLFVELRHGVAYQDAIQAYLKSLLDLLIRRGFQIEASPNTATAEGIVREIPYPFKGTVEDLWSHARFLAETKMSSGAGKIQFRTAWPQFTPGTLRFNLGMNGGGGWVLAQRLPEGGCSVTVALEGEGEKMWQILYARLERLGFWGDKQLGADNAGARPIHEFNKSGTITAPTGLVDAPSTAEAQTAPVENNGEKVKSKRGPRKYSRAEKVAARKEWEELDRDNNPITLEDWLVEKFGETGGTPHVAVSTFYGWPKS